MREDFAFLGFAAYAVSALLLTCGAIAWTLVLVRIVGLRSFTKMTSFDFVTTIATGSLIAQAGTRSDWGAYLHALSAITGVFAVQWLLARARQRWDWVKQFIKNTPVLLMENGVFREQAMAATRVSRANLMAKLRASGVSRIDEVRAVVLETTGDLSVLTGEIDSCMLDGVAQTPAWGERP